MKNIHLIPTDKPSRLVKNNLGIAINEDFTQSILDLIQATFVNIYITSDEEIKEGDWALDLCEDLGLKYQPFKVDKATLKYANQECKKIILTTDQDLIEDGIQAIDDEFLEWFVKNPSCEYVPIITTIVSNESTYKTNIGFESWRKHIIIPKEEPKQETDDFYIKKQKELRKKLFNLIDELEHEKLQEEPKQELERGITITHVGKPKQDSNFYEKLKQYFEETPREKVLEDWAKSAEYDKVGPTVDDFLNNTNKQRVNLQSLESELDEVLSKETEESLTKWLDEKRSKQETLEKVLKTELEFIHSSVRNMYFDLGFKTGGLIGAKWQQERMYSEEEVLNFTQIVLSQYKFGNTNIEQLDLLKETLHQFKNK